MELPTYKYEEDGEVLLVINNMDGYGCVNTVEGGRSDGHAHVKGSEQRRAAAQALAGDGWRVVPAGQVLNEPGPEDRPEPVDPATVRRGDHVRAEFDDGTAVEGLVCDVSVVSETETQLEIEHAGQRLWYDPDGGTVRMVRRAEPEPDPEQVQALAELIRDVGDHVSWHGQARELIRRGVRPPERQP